MSRNPYRQDREEIKELLTQFENLKYGKPNSYIEEDGFERLIEHFEEQEKDMQAMEVIEYALHQYPGSVSILLSKANILIILKKYEEALTVLDIVESINTEEIDYFILRTDAYLALNMHQQAATLLEDAIQSFEGEERVDLLFELSDVYDDYEEFEKVFDCLKLILEQDPTNDEALYKICFWTDYTGRNEESIVLHKQIIEEHPYNELAWFNLGAAYQGLKLHEKAIDAYLYAVAINEKFDITYRNLGDAYIRLRNYKEAIEVLEKAVSLAMPDTIVHEAIAYCYQKLKNYTQARLHYKKAIHISPDSAFLYSKLANTYIEEKQWKPAIKMLEKAIEIKPSGYEFYVQLGRCQRELGRLNEAIVYFENVVHIKPKNIAGWKEFLKSLYLAKLNKEGLEYALFGYEQTGKKPGLLYYIAAFQFAVGKNKEALLTLENALAKQPKLLKIFLELNPSFLQQPSIAELVARYKGNARK